MAWIYASKSEAKCEGNEMMPTRGGLPQPTGLQQTLPAGPITPTLGAKPPPMTGDPSQQLTGQMLLDSQMQPPVSQPPMQPQQGTLGPADQGIGMTPSPRPMGPGVATEGSGMAPSPRPMGPTPQMPMPPDLANPRGPPPVRPSQSMMPGATSGPPHVNKLGGGGMRPPTPRPSAPMLGGGMRPAPAGMARF